jgi:hypothetical protein
MLEISNNSTSIFKSCQKKYYWKYIKGLSPYKKSSSLTLGSIIHSAFDMYYNGFSDEEVVRYIKQTSDEEISKASPDTAEDLVVMKYTLLGMWLYYPKDLSVFMDIKPEIEIHMNFIDGVTIILKADGLVTKDGRVWIRELKTSSMDFNQFEKRCQSSNQASLYTYVLKHEGHPVQGIMFDYIKKPLLRKNVKEDKDQFGYRIMMDYKARPDFYFKRHMSYRSDETLSLFERDLVSTTEDILRRCEDGNWYRNTDSCWNFNSPCPYLPICFQDPPDPLTIELFFNQEVINPEKGGTKNAEEN